LERHLATRTPAWASAICGVPVDQIEAFARLVGTTPRTYFRLGGHHIQFNVVGTETLRAAQAHPEQYRDLLVRVAGYSDYFVDIGRDLQEEIIMRTAQEAC